MSTTIRNDLSVAAGPLFKDDKEIRFCRLDVHSTDPLRGLGHSHTLMLTPDEVDALRKALYPFSTAGIASTRERLAKKKGGAR